VLLELKDLLFYPGVLSLSHLLDRLSPVAVAVQNVNDASIKHHYYFKFFEEALILLQ
jgi:hypothetical protein